MRGGTGVNPTCSICNELREFTRLYDADCELVCRTCIDSHAWACDKCGDDVETVVVKNRELCCNKCHRLVAPVVCFDCAGHVSRDCVEHDDEGNAWCRRCANDDSCLICGGSGGGDHPGIRCTSCNGTGTRRRPTFRRRR